MNRKAVAKQLVELAQKLAEPGDNNKAANEVARAQQQLLDPLELLEGTPEGKKLSKAYALLGEVISDLVKAPKVDYGV